MSLNIVLRVLNGKKLSDFEKLLIIYVKVPRLNCGDLKCKHLFWFIVIDMSSISIIKSKFTLSFSILIDLEQYTESLENYKFLS